MIEPVDDQLWLVVVDGFDPLREREVESWFTVANGRSGTRGSLEEGNEDSMPATYLAGLYGRTEGENPGPELATGPEWTRLAPRAGGEAVDLDRGEVLEHRRVLDLRQGMLFRTWRQRLPSGAEVSFRSVRFASLGDRRLLVLHAEARSSGPGVRLSDGIPPTSAAQALESTDAATRDGQVDLRIRARGGGGASFAISTNEGGGTLERLVAVARAHPGDAPDPDPREILSRAQRQGVQAIRARHRGAWRERWRDADVVVDGDAEAQRALRFALYHLISAGDPESDVASIGARGLTGPGYRGHVFWDTEAFMVPFFTYTHPSTARALLSHRHRTLPAARDRATELGYRGALYAWECADTGEETTPERAPGPDGRPRRILTGLQEHHISADVAWAAWRYWQATSDQAFLFDMGAEILLETARFWASRARKGRDGRHHISRVIGPDEYHEGVRDNAFTNVMARWNLERALEVAGMLSLLHPSGWKALSSRIELRDSELRRWREVADGLAGGFDPRTLLYEEFDGFFDLEDVRAADLAARPFAAEAVLGPERVGRSRIVKQPDVLMLAHMLPEAVPLDVMEANYRYYEPQTSHGSSLSPAIHAAVAARIGLLDDAFEYFRMAAGIDLGNRMGKAAQGIHMATMGGLWQAAVMGFGGVRPEGDALGIDPRLPRGWSRLAFPLRWRGSRVHVDVDREAVTLSLESSASVAVGRGAPQPRSPGRHVAAMRGGRWGRLEEVKSS